MIKQIDSNSSLKEKKYKILSYGILLGNTDNIEEDKKELKETAKYLDSANESAFEERLASKDYTTTTLEEEQNRLEDLISCINDRIRERDSFNDTYFQVMHSYVDNLSEIKDIDSLDYYKERLKNINEYLNNVEDIELTKEELDSVKKELKNKRENEANSRIINKKMESILLEEFTKVIGDDEYYTNLNYVDIDGELISLENEIIEKKNTLDTFMASYEALENSGISGSEKDEYKSYVVDVQNDYYSSAEKKYLLNIYKLVLDTCEEYDLIYTKRSKINDILEERDNLRNKLNILADDKLKEFIDVCQEQFAVINSQKSILDDINKLMLDISRLSNKLEVLREQNNREDVLKILEEFKVNDNINSDDRISIEKSSEPNAIRYVDDAYKMDLESVKNTAKVVMKKVVMAIEPKKFTRKKTAKDLQNNNKNNEVKIEKYEPLHSSDKKEEDTFIEVQDPFVKENIEEVVFDNVDPFLDDNNINMDIDDETLANMPRVDNIGSVRPTTKLKEIEELGEENSNIVLPTMGLVDSSNNDVKISSENYLNNETASN